MKIKTYAIYTVSILMVLVVVGFGVNAFMSDGSPTTVIENAENVIVEAPEVEQGLGAVVGLNHYGDFRVHGRFLEGGSMLATSTSGTTSAATMPITDLVTYSGYDFTPGDAAVTLTLPATSTFVGFLETGECINFRIRNLSATSATSTTIAAGTGIDLVENENGDVVIEGGNEAQLRFCRELDTDITVYVDEYIAAD